MGRPKIPAAKAQAQSTHWENPNSTSFSLQAAVAKVPEPKGQPKIPAARPKEDRSPLSLSLSFSLVRFLSFRP